MTVGRVAISIFLCGLAWTFAQAQTTADDPDVLFKKALHLGDLYNWADAATMFTEAERLYAARGDNRNALYAHLGRIRSTMEQLSLPEVSEELGVELDKNPLSSRTKNLDYFVSWFLATSMEKLMPHQCAAIGKLRSSSLRLSATRSRKTAPRASSDSPFFSKETWRQPARKL